jgi:hypothetical protein
LELLSSKYLIDFFKDSLSIGRDTILLYNENNLVFNQKEMHLPKCIELSRLLLQRSGAIKQMPRGALFSLRYKFYII